MKLWNHQIEQWSSQPRSSEFIYCCSAIRCANLAAKPLNNITMWSRTYQEPGDGTACGQCWPHSERCRRKHQRLLAAPQSTAARDHFAAGDVDVPQTQQRHLWSTWLPAEEPHWRYTASWLDVAAVPTILCLTDFRLFLAPLQFTKSA